MIESLAGRFLIASPHLPDSNFSRTVVLMVEHHEEGALGVILNRPTNATLSDIWKYVDDSPFESVKCLKLGGPVEGHLMCLHRSPKVSEVEVLPGVYLASDPSRIRQAVEESETSHVYWGYSGWGAGQLERELKIGGWLVGDATAALVFDDDLSTLWNRVVSKNGQAILREALHISHFPEDPQWN